MQAVTLSPEGIRTPSTRASSLRRKTILMVLSLLACSRSISTTGNSKFSFNQFLSSLERFVISSKLRACFFHNHSYICLARKAFSPLSTIISFNSACVNDRISFIIKFWCKGKEFQKLIDKNNKKQYRIKTKIKQIAFYKVFIKGSITIARFYYLI